MQILQSDRRMIWISAKENRRSFQANYRKNAPSSTEDKLDYDSISGWNKAIEHLFSPLGRSDVLAK